MNPLDLTNATIARFLGRMAICAGAVAILATPALAQAPAGRYTTSGGTVRDGKTHLTWQKTAPADAPTWALARSYCSGVGASLGGTGWRVPTLKELLTIVDDSGVSPSIDSATFDAASADSSSSFWSASPVSGPAGYAWIVDFAGGVSFSRAVSETASVRCVR
jgi:hypothetical protein